MKRIFRHIEYLLLEHDHVIIPQLGGFVANDMPSVWSEEEELFLPPYRTVHFNASLNHGDSTLVDSLAKAYSVPPTEAEKWCAQFVQNIHMELAENGSLDFGSIGVMLQESPEQPITFSPCKAGVTTPEFYGLDAFHMPMLQQKDFQSQKEERVLPSSDVQKTYKHVRQHYTFQINRHLAHTVATLAASIILFVIFSPSLNHTSRQEALQKTQAELFVPTHLLGNFKMEKPVQTSEAPKIKVQPEELSQENNIPVIKEEVKKPAPSATVKKEVAAPQKGFAIVLASAISLQNAESYAKALQTRGLDAHVYQREKMVRVIIPCYDGEGKAREMLNKIKENGSEFGQAWITALE